MGAALRPIGGTGGTGDTGTSASLPLAAHRGLALLLVLILGVPLAWAAASALLAGVDDTAWRALLADPQWPGALGHALRTGLAATAISVALSAWLLSRTFATPAWAMMVRALAPMLAVPHAAFAIGLVLLIAPSGWLLRALSPWATGFTLPPDWPTTQDPLGLGLVAALVAKEIPFLLWTAASQLQRADAGGRWQRELLLARTMGYTRQAAWWRVVWPQLWPRLGAPVLAVGAYSLTVVDVALVIGPATPPTAAVLAWQWLLDADPARNAQGAAAAWMLAALAATLAGGAWLAWRIAGHLRTQPRTQRHGQHGQRPRSARWSRGQRGRRDADPRLALAGPALLLLAYGTVMLALAIGSVSGVWAFPELWPQQLSLGGWRAVAASAGTVGQTALLAAASSLTALAWAVLWLEAAPPGWDRRLRHLAYLPLVLPAILWVVGLHRLTLAWGLDGSWAGLWLAHTLAALPYVLIALAPSYQGFDPRYRALAATLGHGRLAFLLRVKWPLLRAGLASALAVGFAVSVAQYLPTLFIGAGRYATVTTEAVALSAGGQRSLMAAYAWLQWLLPALVFAAAAWAGRPRRFKNRSHNHAWKHRA